MSQTLSLSLSNPTCGRDLVDVDLPSLEDKLHELARRLCKRAVFRLPHEAVDVVLDKLEDRLMRGDAPREPVAWCTDLLKKILFRKPKRVNQTRRLHSLELLPVKAVCERRMDRLVRIEPEWKERLEIISPRLRTSLAPRQAEIFAKIAEVKTREALQDAVRMKGRDLRRCIKRIGEKGKKIRESIARLCPPPPSC